MTDFNLVEGQLRFRFANVQMAQKYDDWAHYKNRFQGACGGSKAVDFIVLQENQLWLIEVKDYRRHRRTKPIDLADEIALKVKDTMAGLLSASVHADVDVERRFARMALKCRTIRVVLHLEQPLNPSRLYPQIVNLQNLTIKLKKALKFADAHPKVYNSRHTPYGPDLTVTTF